MGSASPAIDGIQVKYGLGLGEIGGARPPWFPAMGPELPQHALGGGSREAAHESV